MNNSEKYVQTNLNISAEDARHLDQMMAEDAYDNRSAWVRRLIRQEWTRRMAGAERLVETYSLPSAQSPQTPLENGVEEAAE